MVGSPPPLLPLVPLGSVAPVPLPVPPVDTVMLLTVRWLDRLPIAEDDELERVLALAPAFEYEDDAPLPIGLPMTLTFGLDTDEDCEAEEFVAVEVLPELEVIWA